jgi:hypothetical protein
VRKTLVRITGVLLVITGVAGLIISVGAAVWLWAGLPEFKNWMQGSLEDIYNTLETTSDGLVIVDQSIESSITSFANIEATIDATAKSINDTTPMVDTMIILTRDDLPQTIYTAQLSLDAAQDSAEIIDGLLSFLAGLPLVPDRLYNPQVPLHIALGQVSESLDNIPAALLTIEESLTATTGNIDTIQTEIYLISDGISEIKFSLEEAQYVVDEYQILVSDLQTRTTRFENSVLTRVNTIAIFLTILLVWLAVAQIGMLVQGFTLLSMPTV